MTMTKFTLRRVYIDAQGYGRKGEYWGVGQPLYYYTEDVPKDPQHPREDYIRAPSRADARAIVTRIYPDATFYR